jgi:hypothetical protein
MDPHTFRQLEKLVDYVATGSGSFPIYVEAAIIDIWCWMEKVQPSIADTESPATDTRRARKRTKRC